MARSRYEVNFGIQVLAWLTCLSAAYLLTLPIYRGLFAMDARLDRLRRPPTPEYYLVARHTLPVGHVIDESDLDWGQTPGFFPPDALQDALPVLGKSIHERVLAGEALRTERLSPYEGHGLAALVPPGQRALVIELTTADRVSGFVEPGDRVDVLVTLYHDHRQLETVPILQNVEVLAADDQGAVTPLGQTPDKARLTVVTDPDGVTRLTHAVRFGVPRLVLRPEDDDGEVQPVREVFALPENPSPAREEAAKAEARAAAQAAFRRFVATLPADQRAQFRRAVRKGSR